MSATTPPGLDAANDKIVRLPIRRDLFLDAFAALGAHTDQARGDLIGCTRKQVWSYRLGYTAPLLPTARDIADILGVDEDSLWPRPKRRPRRRAA